jgi:kinesin family protein 2/24
VTPEQARVFYDKLWRLHIDSRSSKKTESQATEQVVEQKIPAEPFQNRIKPGMIVRMKHKYPLYPVRHVAILCPVGALGHGKENDSKDEGKFVCAEVTPGLMADAYNIAIGYQSVVALEDMEKEVLMEFDGATRYYFVTI